MLLGAETVFLRSNSSYFMKHTGCSTNVTYLQCDGNVQVNVFEYKKANKRTDSNITLNISLIKDDYYFEACCAI
jgi:hypothetical protein